MSVKCILTSVLEGAVKWENEKDGREEDVRNQRYRHSVGSVGYTSSDRYLPIGRGPWNSDELTCKL